MSDLRFKNRLSSKKLWMMYAVLFFLSLSVTMIVLLNSRQARIPVNIITPSGSQLIIPAQQNSQYELNLSDFILIVGDSPDERPDYFLLRESLDYWSEEQIKKFWIPERPVINRMIQAMNDTNMDAFFRGIP